MIFPVQVAIKKAPKILFSLEKVTCAYVFQIA